MIPRFSFLSPVRRLALMGMVFALVGLPVVTRAADQGPPPERGERGDRVAEHLQRLAQELGLTEQQKTQIAAILKAEGTKLMALRDDTSMSRREKFQALRKIRDESREQIRALLTPEQQEKFDAMPKPGRGGRGGPGGDGPPPPPAE